jgi:DMSO/TMAO reductase YedYZ heme-binding membrane subunit
MSELINSLNSLLSPIETILKTYRKYIGYFFITLSVLSLGFIFVPDSVKFTGEQSLNLLWILLFMPIFARVIGISLIRSMMPLRKEIGILMGTLALVHGITYISPDPSYILSTQFWIYN